MDDMALINGAIAEAGGRRGPGRPQNSVRTEQITLSLPPAQRELLEELTLTGYFGRNAVETATLLLWQAMDECALSRVEKMKAVRQLQEERQTRDLKSKMDRISQILRED